jgi:hypothetical protein
MEIRIGWNDVGDPTKAGDYKFRDGTVTLTDEQIDLWIARLQDTLRPLRRPIPSRGTSDI